MPRTMPALGGLSPELEPRSRGYPAMDAGERQQQRRFAGSIDRNPAARGKTAGELTGGDWSKLPEEWGTRSGTPVVNDDGSVGVPGVGTFGGSSARAQVALAGKLAELGMTDAGGTGFKLVDVGGQGAPTINVGVNAPAADEWADPFGMGLPPMPPPAPAPEPATSSSSPVPAAAKPSTGLVVAGVALLAALFFL